MQDVSALPGNVPNTEAKPAWKIVRVDEVDSFGPQGPVKLQRATVQIANGQTFTVDVPRQQGWSDALKQAAADHAAELYDALGASSNEYVQA